MGFDPCNHALKIWESIWESNSQHGSPLGSVKVHSFTLFALLGACDVILESFFCPATLQPLTLVVSPRLGLRHKCEYEVKTMEEQRVKARSLACNILAVEGCAGVPEWDYKE
jgi:hypothetical protein